jgi:hypothetical protein
MKSDICSYKVDRCDLDNNGSNPCIDRIFLFSPISAQLWCPPKVLAHEINENIFVDK